MDRLEIMQIASGIALELGGQALLVHDEIVFEVPEEVKAQAERELQQRLRTLAGMR